MMILRIFFGVLSGYAIFVVSALLLFRVAQINPHNEPTAGQAVAVITSGLLFSFLAGWVAQAIVLSGTLTVNYFLAAILGGIRCVLHDKIARKFLHTNFGDSTFRACISCQRNYPIAKI